MEDSQKAGVDPGADVSEAMSELQKRAEHVAGRLDLMANPRRLMILCRLAEGEASVGELLSVVGISQSALSQHLARLRSAGVVATRREAQTIHYRIADPDVSAMMIALYDIFCAGRAQPGP